ncbi:MAG TPA: hypothetical protein VLA09_04600, partial [Longimicrobiales bacterium]|nr:hypothetical protein [Longimicrobiales bacterium]
VNFDVPNVAEDYIHRVGRTARAQLTGEAFTLVSPEEQEDFGKIERAVGSTIERVRLDGFAYEATAHVPQGGRVAAASRTSGLGRRPSARRTSGAEGGDGSEKSSCPRRRRYGKRRGQARRRGSITGAIQFDLSALPVGPDTAVDTVQK